jgi:hypothetical protein
VAARSKSKKLRLEEFLRQRQPDVITEDIWRELIALLTPISESYLRELLHATGLPVEQPFGGVRQHSFEELERSLLEMEQTYTAATDPAHAQACRRAVIQAKDRARLVAGNAKVDPEKRKQKEEMVEWMLVWLENPGIFKSWVRLRKQATECP